MPLVALEERVAPMKENDMIMHSIEILQNDCPPCHWAWWANVAAN